MSEKALTSQQMPKLQAAFAAIVLSTPEGVTALMEDRYLKAQTSLQAGKPLTFEELLTPVVTLLNKVNPKSFERTTRQSCRA